MGTTKIIQIISEEPVLLNVHLDTLLTKPNDIPDRKAITSKHQHSIPIPASTLAMLTNGKMSLIANVGPAMQIAAHVQAPTRIIVPHVLKMMQRLWMEVEFVRIML